MAQVVRAGGSVRVVYMTSGDAFRVAVERAKRRVSVKAADFIAFGKLRQQESLGALRELGLRADAASFLGYPDRGLMPLWLRNWAPDQRFRSRYTRASASPYDRGHASCRSAPGDRRRYGFKPRFKLFILHGRFTLFLNNHSHTASPISSNMNGQEFHMET